MINIIMRYNLIRPDKIQLDVPEPFHLGQYEFEDFVLSGSNPQTIYFVLLTDPDGREHIGSSLDGRVEAAVDAAGQCQTASGFEVDVFDLEMVALNMDKMENQDCSNR